jgi:large subunit ribosomal protein L5
MEEKMAEKTNEAVAEKKKPAPAAKGKGKKKDGASLNVQIAAEGETRAASKAPVRLKKHYEAKVVPALKKEFGFTSSMEVPRVTKVVINCAIKEAVANPKVLDHAVEDLMLITGQKPVLTRAKKAIAAFKVRQGNAVGVMVTLRRDRMFEFLDRLMHIALPRVRDFRGVSPKGFDGRGNFSMGLREQIIFPEINYDKVDSVRGMTVTVTTTAKTNEHARALLTELGMPFRK